MNNKQLQYAILLSEIGNFSLAAEKLNISQPAFSKHILNLEKEVGVQLFNRNNSPSILTPAGEYFIKEAKEIIYKEEQLHRSMQMYKSGEKGKLVIGITPFRSFYLIPKIVKEVQRKYPGIQIKLAESNNDILRKEAADGKHDLTIVNLPVDESIFDVELIEPDQLVLVATDELIENYTKFKKSDEIEIEEAKDIPFVVIGKNQEMRILFDSLCAKSNFSPNIVAEAVNLSTTWSMASCGVGAAILPLQFVNSVNSKELNIFKIKNSYLRQLAIITHKGQYISKHAQYAIDLLTNNK